MENYEISITLTMAQTLSYCCTMVTVEICIVIYVHENTIIGVIQVAARRFPPACKGSIERQAQLFCDRTTFRLG